MNRLLESGEPWFAAAETLLVGVAVALAVGIGLRLLARRVLHDEDRAQRTSLLAFWGVVAIFGLVAVVRLVGGASAESGLTAAGTRLFTTLPDLVVALVVVVAGTVLAAAARSAVNRRLASGRPRYAEPIAATVSALVVAVAVLLAARQIGLQTALADGIVLAGVAAVLLAGALALGLGGRDVASAWAAGRHAKDVLTVGDVVELDGRRGRVLRLGPASVRLGLADGAVAEVPNTVLLERTVVVLTHDEAPEDASGPLDVEAAAVAAEEAARSGARRAAAAPHPGPVDEDVDDEAPTRTFAPASPGEADGAAADDVERAPSDGPDEEVSSATHVLEPGWRQRAEAARAALARAEEEHRSGASGDDRDDDGGPPTEAFERP